ncbi:rolling circle replication-associated protein [Spiroplasma phoeniceum]|uniref:Spiroplasma plectrovirus-related protein n=1 Tax=Spiroplasma phoeniceum P40 TaxID=1276259 RepID=A0A345DP64_9MOLU|nr:plectrovirus svts2 rep protein [Spiroplasma phoeniceum]AXF96002.1 spiroplasma plectrovirus-related protein [Spiroplasma phoeniceum P40]
MENNININAYNRLTKENLYRPYIDNSNFINKKYYVKKVYYGNYVKNIVLPLECVDSFGNGNSTGIKNTGKNETKLLNSRVRSQGNFIRKAIHNFNDCKELGFLTLTYAEKMQDLDKANYHFNLFIKKLKYHFSKYKKNTFINLKYLVVYEYQDRKGIPVIHFHIIFNRFISSNLIREYWPYGINKNLKVKKNTNVFVIKYLTKYFVKSLSNTERQKRNFAKNLIFLTKNLKKYQKLN